MSDFDNVIGKETKKQIERVLNTSFIRDMCHERNMKISKDAIREIAVNTCNQINHVMYNAKEMGAVVVLRRHVERMYE